GRLPVEKLWFRQSASGPVDGATLAAAVKEHQALLCSPAPTPVAARLCQSGVPVLSGDHGAEQVRLAAALLKAPPARLADDAFCFADPPAETPALLSLRAALAPLLEAAGARAGDVAVADVFG